MYIYIHIQQVRCNPYKRFVHFESFVHESIVLLFLPPTCIAHTVAILLHDYRAIYDPPSTSLLYAIHHTMLVIIISCKGQRGLLCVCAAHQQC